MYIDENGVFVIESNQGHIRIVADEIELAVPPEAENTSATAGHDFSPLNPKTIIDDFKNVFINKKKSPEPAAPQDNPVPPEATPQPVTPIAPAQPQVVEPAPQPAPPVQPVQSIQSAQPMPQPQPQIAPQPTPPAQTPPAPNQF